MLHATLSTYECTYTYPKMGRKKHIKVYIIQTVEDAGSRRSHGKTYLGQFTSDSSSFTTENWLKI